MNQAILKAGLNSINYGHFNDYISRSGSKKLSWTDSISNGLFVSYSGNSNNNFDPEKITPSHRSYSVSRDKILDDLARQPVDNNYSTREEILKSLENFSL